MKFVSILFFVFSHCMIFGQNETYRIIIDSIYPVYDNYPKAKKLWFKYYDDTDTDPSETLLFLGKALENGDINFYKKQIKSLMQDYGWTYTYNDTLDNTINKSKLLRYIKSLNLIEWTIRKSDKYSCRPKMKHPLTKSFIEIVNSMLYLDQEITRLVPNNSIDSISMDCRNKFISEIDFNNIKKIIDLCKQNDGLIPNNFDNGIGTYYKLQIIIWHNLKTERNFQKSWDLLLPYIEKTYFAGKIGFTIFMLYDKCCYQHYGYQYYGTLGKEAQIKDKETYKDRKERYRL